ncbi:hypothetical protein [Nocardia sp. NPDC052566]|uniref:hypothetical protein n=1 Tax=Nocardia sp. NPDC052566 TaxID=3364330 RepID=UPI0037CC73D1
MKSYTLVLATTGMILAGAAAIQILNGGDAGAAAPIVDPGNARVGLVLSTGETAALANSPLPRLFDSAVPASAEGIALHPGSKLPVIGGQLLAGTGDVAAEAATHPGGYVSVYAAYPGSPANAGYPFLIAQHWS